jgi:hypothetical protein
MNTELTNEKIKAMVDAFLAWPLPASVRSDTCASMQNYPHRSGTNLMTATEAHQMFEYVLAKVATKTEEKTKLIHDLQDFMRSVCSVCARDGKDTNWDAFKKRANEINQRTFDFLVREGVYKDFRIVEQQAA